MISPTSAPVADDRADPLAADPLALVRTLHQAVRGAASVPALCDSVAADILAVLGCDRVTLRRLEADGGGRVMAESVAPRPAAMGVPALSLPLVVGSQPWGLIACHGAALRAMPPALHAALALFAEVVAGELAILLRLDAAAGALRAEAARRATAEADLAAALRRSLETQEAERRRIARDLHDSLGQSLSLLQRGLDSLLSPLPEPATLHARAAALKALAAEAAREASRLAWELRPPALDDLGLDSAIRALLARWSAGSAVACDLHLALAGARLGPAVETTLYRVLQEALTNIARHAQAGRAGVILRRADGQAHLIVEDDGRGFRPAEAARDGRWGLRGMRERLSLVGGSLDIESAPGRGTTLFARIAV